MASSPRSTQAEYDFATNTDSLATVRARVAQQFDADMARRLRTFHNGVLHIHAPLGRAFLAWLVDTAVVAGTSVAIAAAALMTAGHAPDSASVAVVVAVAVAVVLIVGLPFLYG